MLVASVHVSWTQVIIIIILVTHTVLVAPLNQTIAEGSTLTVTCVSTAATPPTIDWLYEHNDVSQTIVESDRQSWETVEVNWYTVQSVLTIVDVDPLGEGQYRCRSTHNDQQLLASSDVTIDGKGV